MSTPLAAAEIFDREFLAVRAKLIDLAATFDRIDRAEGAIAADPRLDKIRQALRMLAGDETDRAEQIQLLFSLPYPEDWRKIHGL